MIWVVLCLVVAICCGRVVMLRTRPSQAALVFTVAAICSCASFTCQVLPAAIDGLTGVRNLSDIMHHIFGIAAMTLSLLFVATLAPPHVLSRRTLRISLHLSSGLALLVVLQWVFDPGRATESVGDAGGWQDFVGPWSFVTVLYNAYVLGGFAVLVWNSTIGAIGRFEDRIQQWASTVMGCGLAMMGLSQILIVIRIFEPRDYEHLTKLYWLVLYWQSFVFSVGLLLPVPAAVIVRVVNDRRQLAILNPLWSRLTTLFPDAQLQTKRVYTPTKLAIAATRRFVEIGDCLSRLVIPRDEASRMARTDNPECSLGQYLWSLRSDGRTLLTEGECALEVLRTQTSAEDDREHILAVANAFRIEELRAARGNGTPTRRSRLVYK